MDDFDKLLSDGLNFCPSEIETIKEAIDGVESLVVRLAADIAMIGKIIHYLSNKHNTDVMVCTMVETYVQMLRDRAFANLRFENPTERQIFLTIQKIMRRMDSYIEEGIESDVALSSALTDVLNQAKVPDNVRAEIDVMVENLRPRKQGNDTE